LSFDKRSVPAERPFFVVWTFLCLIIAVMAGLDRPSGTNAFSQQSRT
jgi:hypothetical protein